MMPNSRLRLVVGIEGKCARSPFFCATIYQVRLALPREMGQAIMNAKFNRRSFLGLLGGVAASPVLATRDETQTDLQELLNDRTALKAQVDAPLHPVAAGGLNYAYPFYQVFVDQVKPGDTIALARVRRDGPSSLDDDAMEGRHPRYRSADASARHAKPIWRVLFRA